MVKLWHKLKNSGTFMTWSNQFINFGSALFILPLLLTKFDKLEISFWFLVNVFIQLARLADSGFGPTLIRAVSYFKAGAAKLPRNKEDFENSYVENSDKPNFEKLRDLLSTSNTIYSILSWVAVLLLSTIGLLIIWNILSMSEFRKDFIFAFIVMIVNSYLLLQTVKWTSFMTGLDFVAKVNGFNSIIGSVKIFAYIAILLIEPNILLLLIYNLLTNVAVLIYIRTFVRKWFTKNQFPIRKERFFDKEIFQSIWPATWKLGGIYWGNYLLSYGISIIIAQIDNTALMASFLFTQRVIFIIRRISEAPFYANIQKVFKMMALKKFDELKKLSSLFIFLSLAIVTTSLLGIGLFGNWSLSLFNIDTRLVAGGIFTIMVVSIIFEIHAGMMASMYTSTNQIPFLIPSLISGAVMISLGFVVLPIYGLFGVILLQFLVQLAFNYWFSTYLLLKLLKWPFFTYLGDVLRNGFMFVIYRKQAI